MKAPIRALLHLAAGLAALLSACATTPTPPIDWVCLLPEADGQVGRVVVQGHGTGPAVTLEGAFNTARVAPDGRTRFVQADAATMEQRYGALLRALPRQP